MHKGKMIVFHFYLVIFVAALGGNLIAMDTMPRELYTEIFTKDDNALRALSTYAILSRVNKRLHDLLCYDQALCRTLAQQYAIDPLLVALYAGNIQAKRAYTQMLPTDKILRIKRLSDALEQALQHAWQPHYFEKLIHKLISDGAVFTIQISYIPCDDGWWFDITNLKYVRFGPESGEIVKECIKPAQALRNMLPERPFVAGTYDRAARLLILIARDLRDPNIKTKIIRVDRELQYPVVDTEFDYEWARLPLNIYSIQNGATYHYTILMNYRLHPTIRIHRVVSGQQPGLMIDSNTGRTRAFDKSNSKMYSLFSGTFCIQE